MSKTVADVLVGTLEEIGVEQIFALIGDSLNPLADAVRRSSIEWIGVRHEEGAALAGRVPAGEAWPPALTELRWLLEEYAVQLFAQDLRTQVPVSPKRIAAAEAAALAAIR